MVFQPGPAKLDASTLQELNLRLILTAIASGQDVTAAHASRTTGLSPATMSRSIEVLFERELIVAGNKVRGRRGQPGQALKLNPEGAYSAGCQLDFGSGYLMLRNLGGKLLTEREFSFASNDPAELADVVADTFALAMWDKPERVRQKFVALGVAIPADFGRLGEPLIGGGRAAQWDEELFSTRLSQALGVKVTTYPTGNAGTWGELAAIAPPRPADFLYLYIDQHIQSGLLLDGRLWIAPLAKAGSLGRSPSRAGGPVHLYDAVNSSTLMPRRAAAGGEPSPTDLAIDAALVLAPPALSVCETLALPLVILDGSLPPVQLDALAEALRRQLAELCWDAAPRVVRGVSGARAPARGAALRPLYMAYFSEKVG